MDDKQALAIVSALANGANPFSGEIFPIDSPYQTPDVIRALFIAQRALECRSDVTVTNIQKHDSVAPSASQPKQTNAGKPWNADEDKQLLAAFDKAIPIPDIARTHGRTIGGVRARLEKHGRLEATQARWPQTNKGATSRQ